ncbi:MAG: PDZ domain-containing protein [Bryobacterales bacterium]|jgi:predicted metalloprotease with PDZ domain|nr:PDZ domain-containing protein [Bryobacterales bacterium]
MALSPSFPCLLRRSSLLALLFVCTALGALAQTAADAAPFRHTLRFPQARNHYVHVESQFPTGGQPDLEVFMAVWTPGSYLVREYSRNIDAVQAFGPAGEPLVVSKTRKNRWKVRTNGAATVTLRYAIYAREMSVRTNFVDASFAMINGAATFLTPVGQLDKAHTVHLELPGGWAQAHSGLDVLPQAAPVTFHAPDYDTLVDCPIVAGNPDVFEFEVEGKPHFIINTPASDHWDGPRSVADTKRIVQHYARMWRGLPYKKYLFLNMLVEAGGGLEHKNSTVLMASALTTRNEARYRGWLGLVSHEYFHVWNVKRLRPVELGPFDYENENYTEGLWVAEGFTSYYDGLALHRAGLMTQDQYLARLSGTIAGLQDKPGRLVQPVADSSFDAWVKGYRPNENSNNTGISYYTKGAVLGFLLDARIRKATNNARSLDDLMRLAYQRYSGDRGFTARQFHDCVAEIAGAEVAGWMEAASRSTDDFDYNDELRYLGLRFARGAIPGPGAAGPVRGWMGASVKADGLSMVVNTVPRDTPAYAAGLNVEDEILAVGDRRVTAAFWPALGDYFHAGEQVELLVSRRGKLLKLPLTLGAEPVVSWRLELDPAASVSAKASLARWLRGD